MHRRCAAVALLIAAGAVWPAVAHADARTIEVTSVSISVVPHDVAPKGLSKGDTVVYRDRLLNVTAQFGKKKGATVGSDRGTMTFTGPHTARFAGKATFPGGALTLKGRVTGLANGSIVIPVAAGSGTFAGATGTLTVGAGRDRVRNTYRLSFAGLPVA